MIHAAEHPTAVSAPSLLTIYCLATTTNTIPVIAGDGSGCVYQFADYEESYDPAVIAETQAAVETTLNGADGAGPTVADYSLGLDTRFCVRRQNGSTLTMNGLRIGDVLESGGRVSGIVHEACEEVCAVPDTGDLVVSSAQLVFWGGRWQRAGNVWPRMRRGPDALPLIHVLLDGNKTFTVDTAVGPLPVRDYAEHEDDSVTQAAYDRVVVGKPQ
jgi:hypothetical protein